jgi:hypothetical protein
MIYCDYLGSKLAMPRRSGPVEILTEHEPVSRLAWRRGTAVTWKNAQSSKPVDPAATNAAITAVATQLGLDRRLAGGAQHGATASRIPQGLAHGRSNAAAAEIKRSILPNRLAPSRPRRGRDHERALAGGAGGAEIPTQSRPRNGAGQCRER